MTADYFEQKADSYEQTGHRVKNVRKIADVMVSRIDRFYSMLSAGGFSSLADLEPEDGSFYTEDTGVFHCGFEPETLINLAASAGFKNIEATTVSAVHKPQGNYPVQLLTVTR
ncbi:MAG: hypothetical protein JKY89_05975 [Immundisolibacteraceae bacterium]|nr:hypothetical protein [Immundisolibacteraceae bacterium]